LDLGLLLAFTINKRASNHLLSRLLLRLRLLSHRLLWLLRFSLIWCVAGSCLPLNSLVHLPLVILHLISDLIESLIDATHASQESIIVGVVLLSLGLCWLFGWAGLGIRLSRLIWLVE